MWTSDQVTLPTSRVVGSGWEEGEEDVELEGTADPGGVCIVFGGNGGETTPAAMGASPMVVRCGGRWASKSF